MGNKHIIPCGGLAFSGAVPDGAKLLPLKLSTDRRARDDITLEVEDLHAGLYKTVPPVFEDLLEIAAYVYCADQATSRGGKDVAGFGEHWRRDFDFRIPVRVPEFWNRAEVKTLLTKTLGFLSDDWYDFEFSPAARPRAMQEYFSNLVSEAPDGPIDGVMLFSGGLDSLAGAVEEGVGEKRRMMLVTHKPTDKLNLVHKSLGRLLAAKTGRYKPTHLYVRIYKDSDLNKNYTQRTRSFLYATVGATVARMLGKDVLRFYENGVVSMNLPVCAQVVGSRATRTTHPQALAGFGRLLSLVAGGPFAVENLFIWDTKGDIIQRIRKHGCEDLIAASLSCAHVYGFSHAFPHCGTCSQCIDRRMAVVASGVEALDPGLKYKSDVFTGTRPTDEDRMMVATFVTRAQQLGKMADPAELIKEYPEVARIVGFLEGTPASVAHKILMLHRRHAGEVKTALERMVIHHAKEIAAGSLAPDCLLRLVYDSGGGTPGSAPAAQLPAAQPCLERQTKRLASEAEGPNVYRLGRGYKGWHLVFGGKSEALGDERGLELVDYLLKHPGAEAIHASVLEKEVDGAPLADGAGSVDWAGHDPAGGGDPPPDSDGIGDGDMAPDGDRLPGDVDALGGPVQEAAGKKLEGGMGELLERELRRLRIILNDDDSSDEARAAARKRIRELLSGYKRGGGVDGGSEKAAERVRKAIRPMILELKKWEKRPGEPDLVIRGFGDHLDEYLWRPSMGGPGRAGAAGRPGCYTYEPPPGVVWKD